MGNLIICSIAVSFVVVYNVRALIFEQIITYPEMINKQIDIIYNGNWTEWSAIWSEIICMISKSNSHCRSFYLKSQV